MGGHAGRPVSALNLESELLAGTHQQPGRGGGGEASNGGGEAAAVVRGGAGGLALPHPEPALWGLPPAWVVAAAPRGGDRGLRARPRRRRRRRPLRRARARRLHVLPPGASSLLLDPWSGCSNSWSARFWLREKKRGWWEWLGDWGIRRLRKLRWLW